MVSRVKRYFLEIKNFSNIIDLNLPENYKIILDDKNDFQLNKFFYKQIGLDHIGEIDFFGLIKNGLSMYQIKI